MLALAIGYSCHPLYSILYKNCYREKKMEGESRREDVEFYQPGSSVYWFGNQVSLR